MLSEKRLVWKVKHGCRESMRRIYELYKDDLLTLANALLNDMGSAEDVVHDVFVSFVRNSESFKLRKSLKAYLATCVRNLAYDRMRTAKRHEDKNSGLMVKEIDLNTPDHLATQKELTILLREAIEQLPFDQRETVILRLRTGLTFKQIASMQNTSINTVQGRYRYAITKLRSLSNGEVEK
jgi:RNA polymerase sigma-70 factor (ECF subfamily)